MKKHMIGILLLGLLLLAQAGAEEGGSMGILYRVSGGKNEMVILGSIHIGVPDMLPYGDAIEEAMASADVFGFECDTQNIIALLAVQSESRYPAGDSLRCHVSEDTMQLLTRLSEKLGLNLNRMLGYRPWAVINVLMPQTVSVLLEREDGTEAIANGVDSVILSRAEGKSFTYLETVQQQLDALNSLSDDLQEQMLAETCRLLLGEAKAEGLDQDMKEWGKWWHNGDAEAFASSYRNTKGAEADDEYLRIMLTERNDRMAERLIALLEGDESHSYLVTVGLMHLVLEEDSIPSRLRQAGYRVEQIRP